MKHYLVTDTELTGLDRSSLLLTIFIAAATFFAGAAVSLWEAIAILPDPKPVVAVVLHDYLLPPMVGIALVFVAACVVVVMARETTVGTIKKEHEPRQDAQ